MSFASHARACQLVHDWSSTISLRIGRRRKTLLQAEATRRGQTLTSLLFVELRGLLERLEEEEAARLQPPRAKTKRCSGRAPRPRTGSTLKNFRA